MPFLQPKLSLKVSQRQILTPGLMQMVSVLALNKLELKEMINAEIVENPVLEEVEEHVPLLDDVAGRDAERERPAEEKVAAAENTPEERDPFEEIDFGSYFQDYLDPGYRTGNNFESYDDKPSFENFLSVPQKLADHLIWQIGSLNLSPELREAAEYIVGNLNEDGYLIAGDAELLNGFLSDSPGPIASRPDIDVADPAAADRGATEHGANVEAPPDPANAEARKLLQEALTIVRSLDPVGVGATTLRECLLLQVAERKREYELIYAAQPAAEDSEVPMRLRLACFDAAALIIRDHLSLLQKRDTRELSKIVNCSVTDLQAAVELIRTLDPKPGQRFNRSSTRLIEPDVAFVKRGDEVTIVLNEEDIPTLRLNHGYKKLLTQAGTEKDVKDYVKERYRSALMLMRNIEQRKSTILKTCEAILRRQPDFLELGVESLRPMMIKDVAEEIGVHPSTVSRAVSNKYVHTAQGVYELRFFFTEGVNGPEGAGTPLMLLKRKVKKLIEEEDPQKPLTDDHIALVLRGQGIRVTRRTVAKYREDLNIPSTHQRRVRP
jgi:RNA polymerase sigma-54 factor